MNRAELVDRLNRAVQELDRLATTLTTVADRAGLDVMQMQYPSGEYAMSPIVTAQAQVLAALAQLEASG